MTQTLQRVSTTTVHPRRRRWLPLASAAAVLSLLAIELAVGWSSLATALHQLRTPHIGWLAVAVVAELTAMSAYARMQRLLLRSAGVRASQLEHVELAYAAHSLNETLPGGPAFSTRLNYQEMRRFGASPAVASWAIALSGILSSTALAAITVGGAFATGGAVQWSRLSALLAVALLLILGVRHLTRHPGAADAIIRSPLATFNRLRRRPATEGRERIAGFLDQLRVARLNPAHILAAVVLALLNWLLDAACLWLCFYAVGERPAPSATVVLAFCAAMAAGSITIVPGGLGIIDSALIIGLITAGGVASPAAIATVVLYRIISFGFIITLGWLSWLHIRVRAGRASVPASPEAATPSRTGPRTSLRRLAVCPRHASLTARKPTPPSHEPALSTHERTLSNLEPALSTHETRPPNHERTLPNYEPALSTHETTPPNHETTLSNPRTTSLKAPDGELVPLHK